MPLSFEWNERKARSNLRKHGVSFLEAASVLADPMARIFAGDSHSGEEAREIIIGHSRKKRLLIVVFTDLREELVRIISARRATGREQRDYEEHATN